MKLKKLLLVPIALFISACGPTSNPTVEPTSTSTSTPTIEPTSQEPEAKKIDVIVMAGQSNMEGHSWNKELQKHVSVEKFDEYINGYEDFKMCYKVGCYGNNNNSKDEFKKVKIGQSFNVSFFGPELGMAEYFEENKESLENELAFIKFAVGGTTIYKEWRSPSSVDDTHEKGYLYSPFINYVKKAMSTLIDQGYEATIRAVCWMQGESDGLNYASFYEELEHNFICDTINDLAEFNEEETIKFVDAGIYNASWVPNYSVINRAKIKNHTKDPDNRFYFDTIEAGLEFRNEPEGNPDTAHFDSLAMIELGRMFAETIMENDILSA